MSFNEYTIRQPDKGKKFFAIRDENGHLIGCLTYFADGDIHIKAKLVLEPGNLTTNKGENKVY